MLELKILMIIIFLMTLVNTIMIFKLDGAIKVLLQVVTKQEQVKNIVNRDEVDQPIAVTTKDRLC